MKYIRCPDTPGIDIPPDQVFPIAQEILRYQSSVGAVDQDVNALFGHRVLGNHQKEVSHAPNPTPPATPFQTRK